MNRHKLCVKSDYSTILSCRESSSIKRKPSHLIPKLTFIFILMPATHPEFLIQVQRTVTTRSDRVYQAKRCHRFIWSHAVAAYTKRNLSVSQLPGFSLRWGVMSGILVNLIFTVSAHKYWVHSYGGNYSEAQRLIVKLKLWLYFQVFSRFPNCP